MQSKNYEVRFYKETYNGKGKILAVFPDSITDREASTGNVLCYSNIMVQGEAEIEYVAGLELATKAESWSLFSELRGVFKVANKYAMERGLNYINLTPVFADEQEQVA